MNQNHQQSARLEKPINLDLKAASYLTEHRFQETAVLPGAAYIEMILAVAAETFGFVPELLSEIEFHQTVRFSGNAILTLNMIWSSDDKGEISVQFYTHDNELSEANRPTDLFMSGKIPAVEEPFIENPYFIDLQAIREVCQQRISQEVFYDQLWQNGNQYGTAFQAISQIDKGENDALGNLQISELIAEGWQTHQIHPIILDACIQTLGAMLNQPGWPFLWKGVGRIIILSDGKQASFVYAKRHAASEQGENVVAGDVYLVDDAGQVLVALLDVQLQYVPMTDAASSANPQSIAIVATFTAEPLEASLDFWCQTLGMPFEIAFAPYNQVFQQLLDPDSLLSRNKQGINVLLIRPEDWIGRRHRLELQVSLTEKERLLANHLRYKLWDHVEIAHLNAYETDYLVQEIFQDKTYLKHGISLNDGDCVIDVGANIGLFTLFVEQQCWDATIYAFEPSTAVYDILQTNASLYGSNVQVFNLGLSNETTEAPFTFYKNSSVFSTVYADAEADRKAIRTVVQNMIQKTSDVATEKQRSLADDLMVDRMTAESLTCQLTTLSQIIEEQHIERIDLLKIDVERSELAVLQGIADQDWDIIRQIVIEVHDQEGNVIREVLSMLAAKGFDVVLDEENLLQGSGLYNVYARRKLEESVKLSRSQKDLSLKNHKKHQIMEDFVLALKSAHERSLTPYLVCICPPSLDNQNTDYKKIEQYLEDECANLDGIQLISSAELDRLYPVPDYYDSRADKLGHVPYTPTLFTAVGTMLARKIYANQRLPYKVIVLDCDQTLWQGICSEDGADGVVLDAPRRMLQEFMLAQYKAGMLLCLCSKNSEADVLNVFKQRPEMPLTLEHMAAWRCNWQPKSENIRSLAQELQLGLDAFIFIDDNPLECEEVRANCPDILTLQLPQEPEQIPTFLRHVWAFDRSRVTAVDQQRTAFYQQNNQRRQLQEQSLGLADFLKRLQLEIEISPMMPEQLARVSQLTYRTNQFNCTTIRRTEAEIQKLVASDDWDCLTVSVRDRFGDYGLVGVILFESTANEIQVDTFLLSCRALGREVEHHMLAKLGQVAQARRFAEVIIPYVGTARNQPAYNFLEDVGSEFKVIASEPAALTANKNVQYIFPSEAATNVLIRSHKMAGSTDSQAAKIHQPSAAVQKIGEQANSNLFSQVATELNQANRILEHIEERVRENSSQDSGYQAPSSELEVMIADIWQRVLNMERVGVSDNFFDIGGTSLKGVQMIALLERGLSERGIVIEISPISLMKHVTIKELAKLIEAI